VTRKTWDLTAS